MGRRRAWEDEDDDDEDADGACVDEDEEDDDVEVVVGPSSIVSMTWSGVSLSARWG